MLLFRVWMGILGIQDLTKIRHRNQQNLKSWSVRDLTAPQEVGLTKIWAWDVGFFTCLLGISEIVTIQIKVVTAKAGGVSFYIKQQSMPG